MAVSKFFFLCLFLSIHYSESADPPSPAPSPDLVADSPVSDKAPVPAPGTGSPALAPGPGHAPTYSPPAPSPSDLNVPSPSPMSPTAASIPGSASSPAPGPMSESDVSHSDINADRDEGTESSGGMTGGKKAGIAVAVIAAVCLVGLGGLVYKKRQDNIRRSQYSYAARRDIL